MKSIGKFILKTLCVLVIMCFIVLISDIIASKTVVISTDLSQQLFESIRYLIYLIMLVGIIMVYQFGKIDRKFTEMSKTIDKLHDEINQLK